MRKASTHRYIALPGIPPTREGGWWVARVFDTETKEEIPTGLIAPTADEAGMSAVDTAMAWNKPKPSWLRRVFGIRA